VKSALRVDRTPDDVAHRRRVLCEGDGSRPPCERLTLGAICSACGCIARAKVLVAGESCPLGKWSAAPRK
jgi:hypothetical protein